MSVERILFQSGVAVGLKPSVQPGCFPSVQITLSELLGVYDGTANKHDRRRLTPHCQDAGDTALRAAHERGFVYFRAATPEPPRGA